MMIDAQLLMSDQQDLAQVVGTYLGDKSIDLGASATDTLGNTVIRDMGRGLPVNLEVQVTETFTSGGSATVRADLVIADDEGLTSNKVILQSTQAIDYATLVAGYKFRLGGTVPPGINKRYLGVQYVIAGATTTAGAVSAFIATDRQTNPTV